MTLQGALLIYSIVPHTYLKTAFVITCEACREPPEWNPSLPSLISRLFHQLELSNLADCFNLRCALLQINLFFNFTACEKTLKIHTVLTEAYKIGNHSIFISKIIFYKCIYLANISGDRVPQERLKEIKRMTVMYSTHGLFLTCTQNLVYIYTIYN